MSLSGSALISKALPLFETRAASLQTACLTPLLEDGTQLLSCPSMSRSETHVYCQTVFAEPSHDLLTSVVAVMTARYAFRVDGDESRCVKGHSQLSNIGENLTSPGKGWVKHLVARGKVSVYRGPFLRA